MTDEHSLHTTRSKYFAQLCVYHKSAVFSRIFYVDIENLSAFVWGCPGWSWIWHRWCQITGVECDTDGVRLRKEESGERKQNSERTAKKRGEMPRFSILIVFRTVSTGCQGPKFLTSRTVPSWFVACGVEYASNGFCTQTTWCLPTERNQFGKHRLCVHTKSLVGIVPSPWNAHYNIGAFYIWTFSINWSFFTTDTQFSPLPNHI